MPINIPNSLPAKRILEKENIFVITETRAIHQDIRPMEVLILNLMPTKIETETQLLRMLSNTPLQTNVTLLHPKSHVSKHAPVKHLATFYKYFDDINSNKYDGLIITGAPVEHLRFEEVDYWEELKRIMDWSVKNVFTVLYLCWAAQAGLYHHFDVPKRHLAKKTFGVFSHQIYKQHQPLLRGFDDEFFVPVSRHSEVHREDIEKIPELEILAESEEAGVCIVQTRNRKHVFNTAHLEYDSITLKREYERDVGKRLKIHIPKNYFPNNDPAQKPMMLWRAHAHLFFSNWLNYYVYQETPYDLKKISTKH